jgi:hypothetical protein
MNAETRPDSITYTTSAGELTLGLTYVSAGDVRWASWQELWNVLLGRSAAPHINSDKGGQTTIGDGHVQS